MRKPFKIILLILPIIFLMAGCSSSASTPTSSSNLNSSNSIYQSSQQEDNYQEEPEVGNPYDEDTGHSAGYNWAEETGGDCSTGNQSFDEGCEEYNNQVDEHEEWEDNQ